MSEQNALELAEAQLQEELRSMFAVDSQAYLQSYVDVVGQISTASWIRDIQEIYRCVHTIKGGAVTVGADAILEVSTVLEDLLSDLRFLKVAPPLEDGLLKAMLLEAGELLTASLGVMETGEAAMWAVQPSLERIAGLRREIQRSYIPESDERTKVAQEFAEQGFDLVVLDLEMSVEKLTPNSKVPAKTIAIAKQTLKQLLQIGTDLKFEPSWKQMIANTGVFFKQLDSDFWQSQWPLSFKELKESARNVGRLPKAPEELVETVEAVETPETVVGEVDESVPIAVATKTTSIAVSLERLDRSAQYLVETVLASRMTQGSYKNLQEQIQQLVDIAKESVDYITRLRQVQDDYVLLDNLQARSSSSGPIVERYRQGYIIINRLLESSLRLSELGAEAAITARQTAENIQTLDRHILDLQNTVEESRLISFQTLALRARGILRELVTRYQKPAKLTVQGEQMELDAATAQAIEPAMLHLLRNAYDHGLEPPMERTDNGKSEEGQVFLSLKRQGNLYLLEVRDDGRGIDPEKISNLAKKKGMPLTNTQTPNELLAVLCQAGFSSQQVVSDISGRGVGMDVVASQLQSISGKLFLDTQVGKGTSFRMQIPVPHLFVRCIVVRVGDRRFAIPSEEITTTVLWSTVTSNHVQEQNYSWLIQYEGTVLPALDLLEYWQPNLSREIPETSICMRIRSISTGKEAWLIADDIIEQLELLINPIPDVLQSPVGLMGVSLQTDGKLIPVIEPERLAQSLTSNSNNIVSTITPEITKELEPAISTTILVVDDAALLRRRLEVSLTSYGYTVQTCRDGLEAWNWLSNNPRPALVITDIEMPNMDGFTLINRCRQEAMNMPMVVISSRLSEEWGKEAQRLGANDYLNKGFTTPELINKVNQFVNSR